MVFKKKGPSWYSDCGSFRVDDQGDGWHRLLLVLPATGPKAGEHRMWIGYFETASKAKKVARRIARHFERDWI